MDETAVKRSIATWRRSSDYFVSLGFAAEDREIAVAWEGALDFCEARLYSETNKAATRKLLSYLGRKVAPEGKGPWAQEGF